MTNQQNNLITERIDELLNTGKVQEALDLCRLHCQTAEFSEEGWLAYGCLSADCGDRETAMMALGKAVQMAPDFVEAQFGLGKLLAAGGDYPAAIDRLQAAADLQPDNADIWLALGIVYGLANLPDNAEACCRRSLDIQPDFPQARYNLANALQVQGKLAEAENEYESVLQTDPGMAAGWSMLAQARVGLQNHDGAEAAARQALALEPSNGEAHFTLGGILEERADVQGARYHFQQAAQLMPELPDAHLRLGTILQELGDSLAAEESYRRALSLDPDMLKAHFLLGEIFHERKMPDKAELHYRHVLSLNNDHLQAHYRLAFLLVNANRNVEAAEHFAEILRLNPQDEQAKHLFAAQSGMTTTTAPAEYVAGLFDEFADTFEEKLVGTLKYQIPERMYEAVKHVTSATENSLAIIDLGCGTGLCAPLFRGMARKLHGVDISSRMIDKARERKLYDVLDVADITTSLKAGEAAWDLAIAADVLLYIGDLKELFAACFSALRPGGVFAFSIEAGADDSTFILQPTGRFTHSSAYIRSLAAELGLREIDRRAVVVRKEKGKDVRGFIFLLRKPDSTSNPVYEISYTCRVQ